MLQKEDTQLSNDVEINDSTLYDTPLSVYRLCFPNNKDYKAELLEIYQRAFAPYLSTPTTSIKEIEAIVTSSKKGMSKLDMDIYVKAIIEGEFQVEVEWKTNLSMDIITSSTLEDLIEQEVMSEKLTIVKTEPSRLSDYAQYHNKVVTGVYTNTEESGRGGSFEYKGNKSVRKLVERQIKSNYSNYND